MAKLADASDLGSDAVRHGGSSPSLGTNCGSNSVGRVTAFQAVGREFESRLPLIVHT